MTFLLARLIFENCRCRRRRCLRTNSFPLRLCRATRNECKFDAYAQYCIKMCFHFKREISSQRSRKKFLSRFILNYTLAAVFFSFISSLFAIHLISCIAVAGGDIIKSINKLMFASLCVKVKKGHTHFRLYVSQIWTTIFDPSAAAAAVFLWPEKERKQKSVGNCIQWFLCLVFRGMGGARNARNKMKRNIASTYTCARGPWTWWTRCDCTTHELPHQELNIYGWKTNRHSFSLHFSAHYTRSNFAMLIKRWSKRPGGRRQHIIYVSLMQYSRTHT